MKVALLQCPAWGRDCPPYTVALLSAILRNKGHKAFGFDLNNALYCTSSAKYKKMWDDKDNYNFWNNPSLVAALLDENQKMIDFFIDKILDSGAMMIGFTVHFSSQAVSLEIARRIKQADKNRLIVFGGPDTTLNAEVFIGNEFIDVAVVAEGDETAVELANILEEEGKVEFCPGTYVKKNGKAFYCGDRKPVQELDELPFPDYSDFKKDILLGHYRQPERLDILDSRGCVNRCHFCSEWQFWKNFRTMSGKRIFEEIAYQMKRFPGVNYFYFIGSLLNGNVRELNEFCDLVISSGTKIRWSGQAIIRPEMTREMMEKMKKAGCEWLGYGVESGSQRVVKNMNKHFSISVAEEVLENTRRAGIGTQVNFMFGIPTETREDFRQTLEFLERNCRNMDSILASQSFCTLDSGTFLYNHADELGIRFRDHHLYWETDGNDYPERFSRYEEFCRLALSLGIPETSGVLRVKPDKWLLLGDYFLFKKDFAAALECFEKSIKSESNNASTLQKIQKCKQNLKKGKKARSSVLSGLHLDQRPPAPKPPSQEQGETPLSAEQEKVKAALLKLGLQQKLNNYLLIESEKEKRLEEVSGYPYWLTVDPANYCNLRCPFCPTGQQRGSRGKGILTLENFQKIADELGPYLIHIDFCNWGEPFLNPDLPKLIKYSKQYQVDTKVDSNLNHLDEKTAEELILSGLDKIIVSIDGASAEVYSKYRVNGDFNKAIANLALLIRKKKELNRPNPFICWQFLVFRHNEHQIEQVRRMGQDMGVDNVSITKAFIGDPEWFPLNQEYSNYRKESGKKKLTSEFFKPPKAQMCNWPWEEIVINPNGSVSVCCSVEDEANDFGNIFSQPFKEIWNNSAYKQARRYIKYKSAPGDAKQNICIGCRHAGMINIDILSCHSLFTDQK